MNEPVRPATAPRRRRAAKTDAAADTPAAETGRTNDPEATMADILDVATREFAAKGLAGARIDEIAAATRTSKRMIYYYFGSKEGLYVAVLEEAYRRIRHIETDMHLEDLEPETALRRLVAFTCDYQRSNPDFIRLVMNENMHHGEFLAQSRLIQQLNVPAINLLRSVYERGVHEGVFRSGIDPIDLHMSISALSVFNVSNRHTFSLIFKHDFDDPAAIEARRDSIVEMIVRFVRA
ncbi:TetR family transcriptional regulator [Sphaerotilus sulfidivorans]|jgi:AcrR family transcriptional regulator|uniref:TetR/AcrR family transcriptional regulator n=1 Tax=Sphaerotilus sulfidivorans TaxID=639200 RepID=UPI001C7FE68D|nr:TetR/AcrR family transcriptional regulator [Sphaerotilus sulfidivorans]MCK6404158.1 TetR family transcriptional regulator [Sphaerotilus sulfidivorans]GIX53954.1 TetR family transcriptional regulator [Sphaerotilus natans]